MPSKGASTKSLIKKNYQILLYLWITSPNETPKEHDYNLQRFYDVKIYNINLNENKITISANSITLLGYVIHNNQISLDYNRLKPLLEMSPLKNLKSQKRIVGMFSYYSKLIQNFSDKILLLNSNKEFPLKPPVLHSFEVLKNNLKSITLITIEPDKEFEVETDASKYCIAATLNLQGRPVAFFSRTLSSNEILALIFVGVFSRWFVVVSEEECDVRVCLR